ncbi:MAG: GNAT family N-acetyltransferase [Chitinispirillaceae bacterium]|nr:GNAT family N-acetyltransferase [Chitinispirillaceae bacterium]
MKNSYINTKVISTDIWLQLCKESPYATFFHTPYWAQIFEKLDKRCKAITTGFLFENQLKAILPSVVKQNLYPFLKSIAIMPATTFGGWISKDILSNEEEKFISLYVQKYKNIVLRENPYNPMKFTLDKFKSIEDFTWVINLEKGYKSAWESATDGHRNAVRNAIKKRLEVTISEEEKDWQSYYEIYLHSIKRWKEKKKFRGVSYSWNFFLALKNLESSVRKLWLAKINGKCIAGILCFYWNKHCVVWHGAALSEYFSYHPNNFLYDRAIEDAAKNGYLWFDCNPSGGLVGVNNFKKYLGAKPLRSRIFIKQSFLLRTINFFRILVRRNSFE